MPEFHVPRLVLGGSPIEFTGQLFETWELVREDVYHFVLNGTPGAEKNLAFVIDELEGLYPDAVRLLLRLRDAMITTFTKQHHKTFSRLQRKHDEIADAIAQEVKLRLQGILKPVRKHRKISLGLKGTNWRAGPGHSSDSCWMWGLNRCFFHSPNTNSYTNYLVIFFRLELGESNDPKSLEQLIANNDGPPAYIPRIVGDVLLFYYAKLVLARGQNEGHVINTYWLLKTRQIAFASYNRELVARRSGDDQLCAYCGQRSSSLEASEVVPRVLGGPIGVHNLVFACGPCRESKGDKDVVTW